MQRQTELKMIDQIADPNPLLSHSLAYIIFDYLTLRDVAVLSDTPTYGIFTETTMRLVKNGAEKKLKAEKSLYEQDLQTIKASELFIQQKAKGEYDFFEDRYILMDIVYNYLQNKIPGNSLPEHIKKILACLARLDAFRGGNTTTTIIGIEIDRTLDFLGNIHSRACHLLALDIAEEILKIHLTIWPVNFRRSSVHDYRRYKRYEDFPYSSTPLSAMSYSLASHFKKLCDMNREEWSKPSTTLAQPQSSPLTWLQEALLYAIEHKDDEDLRNEGVLDILQMSGSHYKQKMIITSRIMLDFLRAFRKSQESFFVSRPYLPYFKDGRDCFSILVDDPGLMRPHPHFYLTQDRLNQIEKMIDEIETLHFTQIYDFNDLDEELKITPAIYRDALSKTFDRKISTCNSLPALNNLYQQYLNKSCFNKTRKLLFQKQVVGLVLTQKPIDTSSLADYVDICLSVLQGPLFGNPDAKDSTPHEKMGLEKEYRVALEDELFNSLAEIFKNKVAKDERHFNPKLQAYFTTYFDLPVNASAAKTEIRNVIITEACSKIVSSPPKPFIPIIAPSAPEFESKASAGDSKQIDFQPRPCAPALEPHSFDFRLFQSVADGRGDFKAECKPTRTP